MRSFSIAVASLVLSACAQLPILNPPAHSDFERTLSKVRRSVDAGDYLAADRLLEEFVRTHPETREAREMAFWKAMYMVDPANYRGSLAGGIAALDSYLAADSTGWYRNEALVLRRTAALARGGLSNTPVNTAGAPAPGTRDTVVVGIRSRDEEIALLKEQLAKSKEELAKLNAELERIKKRLANPSK